MSDHPCAGKAVIQADVARLIKGVRAADAGAITVEMPSTPEPRDRYLAHGDVARLLLDYATIPHIELAIHLMLGTAARIAALFELTWDRVDFVRRQIRLYNSANRGRHEGRAVVAMINSLLAYLQESGKAALTNHVIEWAGAPVKSIKKGTATIAHNAEVKDVSPYV